MKDCNGILLERGDVVVNNFNRYREVVAVRDRVMILTLDSPTIECAREENGVMTWGELPVYDSQLRIVERRPLGVYDKNGKEWHYGDKVQLNGIVGEVFDGIKTIINDRSNFILVKVAVYDGGWGTFLSTAYEIFSPTPSAIATTVTINGKEAKLSEISEETLLRLRKENV